MVCAKKELLVVRGGDCTLRRRLREAAMWQWWGRRKRSGAEVVETERNGKGGEETWEAHQHQHEERSLIGELCRVYQSIYF